MLSTRANTQQTTDAVIYTPVLPTSSAKATTIPKVFVYYVPQAAGIESSATGKLHRICFVPKAAIGFAVGRLGGWAVDWLGGCLFGWLFVCLVV